MLHVSNLNSGAPLTRLLKNKYRRMDGSKNDINTSLLENIILKDKEEQLAIATTTTEILSKLNISIDTLPQKCQEILKLAACNQLEVDIDQLDPVAISLQQSLQISRKLNEEYEILKLKQKNTELQTQIDRNRKFLDGLRNELNCSRNSLASQTPNPENIQDHIKQMKQKVASYEESCKKATMKFSKLSVPDSVLPKALQAQLSVLNTLHEEAVAWRQRADDVVFTRDARDTFNRLRR